MKYKIGVVGCGYVGFNLIKTFSKKYDVVGYDISKERIDFLNENHRIENVIYTTKDINLLSCNVYLISVPTNIDTTTKKVNLDNIIAVKKMLEKNINTSDIIVLESSIYVGGTRDLFNDFLEKNIYIGFSPERISPGDHEDCDNIPKIISGLDLESLSAINLLYSTVIKSIIEVSTTECAETCKLYENCFRVINIAYVNEIADMCRHRNININEVIKASSTKPFGFMPFYPGFGVGGFCLPQNPYYLMHKSNTYILSGGNEGNNPTAEFPLLSNSINLLNNRPYKRAKEIKHDNILLVGVGFKPNQTLTAFSPSLALYNELIKQNKNVTIYDKSLNINKDFKFNIKNLKQFECIIIGCKNDNINNSILHEYKKHGEVIYC